LVVDLLREDQHSATHDDRGEGERAVASLQIGHPRVPRRPAKLWHLPQSAFEWHRVDVDLPTGDDSQWPSGWTCGTRGRRLRLRAISYEKKAIRSRRRGVAAVVAWCGFAVLLVLSSRSPATRLILADIVAGLASVGLLFASARYDVVSRRGRWHGHRFKF
jgi:hypothetical protein